MRPLFLAMAHQPPYPGPPGGGRRQSLEDVRDTARLVRQIATLVRDTIITVISVPLAGYLLATEPALRSPEGIAGLGAMVGLSGIAPIAYDFIRSRRRDAAP